MSGVVQWRWSAYLPIRRGPSGEEIECKSNGQSGPYNGLFSVSVHSTESLLFIGVSLFAIAAETTAGLLGMYRVLVDFGSCVVSVYLFRWCRVFIQCPSSTFAFDKIIFIFISMAHEVAM